MMRTALATVIGAVIALGALVGCASETPPHTPDGFITEMRDNLTDQENDSITDKQLLAAGDIVCSLQHAGNFQDDPYSRIALNYCDVLEWSPIYDPYSDPHTQKLLQEQHSTGITEDQSNRTPGG